MNCSIQLEFVQLLMKLYKFCTTGTKILTNGVIDLLTYIGIKLVLGAQLERGKELYKSHQEWLM